MTAENLKNLSLDELLQLLEKSQKTLALSKFHHQSHEEINKNIRLVDKLRRAIEEKRSATNNK